MDPHKLALHVMKYPVVPSPPTCSAFTSSAPKAKTQAVIDSGTTAHYWPLEQAAALRNVQPTDRPIDVTVSNGNTMASTHDGAFPLPPSLPPDAGKVSLFPKMSVPLVSVGQLCDHGCTAKFDRHQVLIEHNNQVIMRGKRNPSNGLWHLNIDQTHNNPCPSANFVMSNKTANDTIRFYHACAGYPFISTWIQDSSHRERPLLILARTHSQASQEVRPTGFHPHAQGTSRPAA